LFPVELGEIDVNAFKIGNEGLPSLPVTVLRTGSLRNDCGAGLFLCEAKVKGKSIAGLR